MEIIYYTNYHWYIKVNYEASGVIMMKKKIRLKYPAIFEVNGDGISIVFPDIPECLSCAFSKKQAYKMAKEALELALHGVNIEEIPIKRYKKMGRQKNMFVRIVVIDMEIKNGFLIGRDIVDYEDGV